MTGERTGMAPTRSISETASVHDCAASTAPPPTSDLRIPARRAEAASGAHLAGAVPPRRS
jgi:hypothetical protein